MRIDKRIVRTSRADIAVAETSGKGLSVLMLHGNSSSKEIFSKQLNSSLGDTYHLIAIDLPGHGESSDAFDPEATYSMPGYAEAVVELLGSMGIEQLAVFGWSLGGHIALETLPRFGGIVGTILTGAPPVRQGAEDLAKGFLPHPHLALAGKEHFDSVDARNFASAAFGESIEPFMLEAMMRTDGRARSLMFQSLFAGRTGNQRAIAEDARAPIAIVNGSAEPFANLEYIASLNYTNLWGGHCHVIPAVGHAAFWQAPTIFNGIMTEFLHDVSSAKTVSGATRNRRILAA